MIGAIAKGARFAGPKLFKFLKGELTNEDLIGRLAPDLAFATLNAAMTPGSVVDKGVAGVTDFTMSGLGGLAAGGIARKVGVPKAFTGYVDMGASVAGGYGSYPVSAAITRGIDKVTGGPGLTGYEKLAQQEQEAFADEIRNNTLVQLGLVRPNPQYVGQDYLASLGLAG